MLSKDARFQPLFAVPFAMLVLSFLLGSCSHEPKKTSKSSRAAATPPTTAAAPDPAEEQRIQELKDEVMVGKGIASKLLGSFGHYDKSPELDRYLNLVGRIVAEKAGRPELTFHFAVLDTEEINALAAPGGYIFLTRGLISKIQTEDELAGVLGHEIAHVTERHMYKDIAAKREVTAGESIARLLSRGGADIGGALNQMVAKGLKMLLEEGYGIEKEAEADAVGIVFAAAAGYDPSALGRVISRIEKGKAHMKLSKTHPSYQERIAAMKKAFAENGLKSGSLGDQAVLDRRFKSAMNAMKR